MLCYVMLCYISYAFEDHVSCRCKRRRKDEGTEDLVNKCFSLKKAVDTVSVHRNHGSQHRNSQGRDKTRLSFAVRLKQSAFLSRRNCKKVKIIFAGCLYQSGLILRRSFFEGSRGKINPYMVYTGYIVSGKSVNRVLPTRLI